MSSKPKSQTVTSTSQTTVPAYLQPYITNMANTGNQALTSLTGSLSSNDPASFVSPFNQAQIDAQNQAISIAGGAGGYIPDALRQIQGTVNGNPAMQRLADTGAEALNTGATQNVVGGQVGTLNNLSQVGGIPGASTNALTSSANGSFLYGNPAFDEAVQASIRAARPNVLSTFSGGGSGAVSGGLAQIGMQQAASDAFARLYDSERNRQVNSASSLGNLSLQDLSRQAQAANAAGGLNLSQQGNNLSAAGNIGSLFNAERARQLQAAGALPDAALSGANILNQYGGIQQNQAQNQLTAPMNAQMELYKAIQQGLPIESLLGQNSTSTQPLYTNKAGGILGGALAGSELGGLFGKGKLSKAIGAIGGGLLGGFL